MLSPTPASILCALLLCLPFAIIFTINTIPATTTNDVATSTPATTNGCNTTACKSTLINTTSIENTTNPPKATTAFNENTTNPKKMKNITIPSLSSKKDEQDDSLLRLAAQINPNRTPPRKLAFLFLTTTLLPFAPLWELYFNNTPRNLYNIYIHADPNYSYDPPFSGIFKNRVIPSSKPTLRNTPTLISAARSLLSHSLLDDPLNSKFAILSPSCIPLHSFNFTYRILIPSNKSFIEILKNEGGAYGRWAARGKDAMLPELPFEEFRIGSQFFVLTRKHAMVVVIDRKLWSKFKMPCVDKNNCFPEEQYFSTLLSMKDPSGCVPATLTHVDWSGRQDGHPRTYEASEVRPQLIMKLRRDMPRYGEDVWKGSDSSEVGTQMITEPRHEHDAMNGSASSMRKRHDPFLFARKFSPDSIQPLLSIASDVIFKD